MALSAELESYIETHKQDFLEDLIGWLRIPSISTLAEHKADVVKAAKYGARQLEQMGMEQVEVIETSGHPLVYAEWLGVSGKPTLLFYGHYDVQPVDPIEEWVTPPFEPSVRDGKIFARGASDDKGQVMTVFKAFQTLLQTEKRLPINVKVLLEGEEETNGKSIAHYMRENTERLRCDGVLICDTSMPAKGVPGLIYALRGIVYMEVEVEVGKVEVESGKYGGVAPDALHALCMLLSRLKSEEGKIQMRGLYEKLQEPSQQEREFWREDPLGMAEVMREAMGVEKFSGEGEYPVLERVWARPSLEVHGIEGGWMSEGAKTKLASRAKAKISVRFPAELGVEEVKREVEEGIKGAVGEREIVQVRCEQMGTGVKLGKGGCMQRVAQEVLGEEYGVEVVRVRRGSSIPIVGLVDSVLGVEVVLLGLGLPDDGIHGPNEGYSCEQLVRGVRVVVGMLQRLGM